MNNRKVIYLDDAIDAVSKACQEFRGIFGRCEDALLALPSEQPERLTDDDFETIRIHLNAYKEKLCNQHRWKEAEEYQRIIDRFMAFASAQPDWVPCSKRLPIGSDIVLLSLPPSIVNGEKLVGGVICGHYISGKNENWGISDGSTFGYGLVSARYGTNPTHWMPLPKPYQEGEQDE